MSTKRRILMLLENNPYPQDLRVKREARSLHQVGYAVTVICPRGRQQPWQDTIDGVQVYRFPTPPEASGFIGYIFEYGSAMLFSFLLSLYIFIRHGFDIIHAHNPPDTFVFIALVYKLFGKKFVFDHHDLAPEMYIALFSEKKGSFAYRALLFCERLTLRRADHIIATNASYKKMEIERGQVPAEKITIVRNGPDLSRLKETAIQFEWHNPKKTLLCYVGEMGYHDGVENLLHALHDLAYEQNRKDFQCVLVGEGVAWTELKQLASDLKLSEFVYFTGWVQQHEVAGYLTIADICVAPEPYNDYNNRSTMIKIMEYMALGKPIVAFDLAEHNVSAGPAALYAQPNRSDEFAQLIAKLIDDQTLRQEMGEIGRHRIQSQLAWPCQEEKLLAAYAMLYGAKSTEMPHHEKS